MGTRLEVCTFNVRRDRGDDGRDNWRHRRELLGETIEEIDPDVIGLQEALPNQFEWIRDRLPRFEWYGVPRRGNGEGEVVPLGWARDRFDAKRCETRWLSERPDGPGKGWDANWQRTATNVRLFDWAGERHEVDIWNAHFDNAGSRARVESARLLDHWTTGQRPCVVIGDLNCGPGDPAYHRIRQRFVDARATASETAGPAETAHGFTGDPDGRIDHVLVTPDVRVHRFETVVKSRNGRYPSDHFPVTANICINEQEEAEASTAPGLGPQ